MRLEFVSNFFCSFLERKEPKELPAKEFLLESKGWFVKTKFGTEEFSFCSVLGQLTATENTIFIVFVRMLWRNAATF